MLSLLTLFHLNLAFSSIEEEKRPLVLKHCYWPLLRLARQYPITLSLEATGYTLETIAQLDPTWIEELRDLILTGKCELIGSGYAQIIGPLVPSEVNAANLRFGHQVYEQILGFRPQLALVNEQAYSASLIQHYLDAGYQGIVMEWNNPAHHHPKWCPEWRYFPQYACGVAGEKIPLIWNNSIAFQKFQHYAHREIEIDEYVNYLQQHLAQTPRIFMLYGNDAEVFDFRPGRYNSESPLREGEWQRVEKLFQLLLADPRFQFISLRQTLEWMNHPDAGHLLHLESATEPIPVKKQSYYNITRWAVTGQDLEMNTACWRIYQALKAQNSTSDRDWRELCYLWGSDFRTHITPKRRQIYQQRLQAFEEKVGGKQFQKATNFFTPFASPTLPQHIQVQCRGRFLSLETPQIKLSLNCQRGLAIDRLGFKAIADTWICGTLYHGYYDDIHWAVDHYSGHLNFQVPGWQQIRDLLPVEPQITYDPIQDRVSVQATILTGLGKIHKQVRIEGDRVQIAYQLQWHHLPCGFLRLGYLVLNPELFNWKNLLYRTHNGGDFLETFYLDEQEIEHSIALSSVVSATWGIGMTKEFVELGDRHHLLRVEVAKAEAALLGTIVARRIGSSYLYQLAFSAIELDETSYAQMTQVQDSWTSPLYLISITPTQP